MPKVEKKIVTKETQVVDRDIKISVPLMVETAFLSGRKDEVMITCSIRQVLGDNKAPTNSIVVQFGGTNMGQGYSTFAMYNPDDFKAFLSAMQEVGEEASKRFSEDLKI